MTGNVATPIVEPASTHPGYQQPMCGICGALSFSGPDFLRPVRALVPLMARRGPDDEGHWSDGAHCALGFRRLAIQDLTPAGHQPMSTPDGRFVLVFNGEVYNFPELRRELETIGVGFRSTGDSQVVLHALARWGVQALGRFNGMFALALYDAREKRLLLARDHAGIKPLYWMHTAAGVLFASQYDQILAHPASRALGLSRDALGLYLRLGYIPAPFAALEHTGMVEAGTWIEIDHAGAVRRGRFFEFPRDVEPDLHGEDAVAAVDEAIGRAVARQLVSDVPVGAFLSGGIDSPLVAAKIRASGNESVRAFTIGTGGHATDESADARQYAREIGIAHVVEHILPERSLELLDDVVDACGEPFGDFSIFPTMLVSRLARREVTVMLSGDGGDELFWGYAKRFAPVIDAAPDFAAPLAWRRARWAMKKHLGFGNAHYNLMYADIGSWYRAKHSHLTEDFLTRAFVHPPGWPQDFPLYAFDGHTREAAARWTRWNEFTGRMTMILMKVDRASMHESLEVRVPLLDREVVGTAARIDWRSCLDPARGLGKLPLRRVLARHIHHQTQAKRGFTVPMASWLKGPLRSVFEQTVLDRKDFLGFELDRPALRALFERFVRNDEGSAWGFWLLLSLALWERRHYTAHRFHAAG